MRTELGSPSVDFSESGEKPAHNCGIAGVIKFTGEDVAAATIRGLDELQHRGKDGAGLAVVDASGCISGYRQTGKIRDVFTPDFSYKEHPGSVAIAQTRYGTSGPQGRDALQPFHFSTIIDGEEVHYAVAQNGNIPRETTQKMSTALEPGTELRSGTDTEVLGATIQQAPGNTLEKKVVNALKKLRGAYSLVIVSDDGSLIAARDPQGIRPLRIGQIGSEGELEGYAFASETVALDAVGASDMGEVKPGSIVRISPDKQITYTSFGEGEAVTPCALEKAYIARDMDEIRRRIGRELALEMPDDHPALASDLIIGVPDSAVPTAEGFTSALGLVEPPGSVPVLKKITDERSFIAPDQASREEKVRAKFWIDSLRVQGRSITLIDDSVIRGTTTRILVQMFRDAGATEVHVISASPKVVDGCDLGVDINPAKQRLAALDTDGRIKDEMEIKGDIGADSIYYMSFNGFESALEDPHCTSCFGGEYPLPDKPESKTRGPIPITLFTSSDREAVLV